MYTVTALSNVLGVTPATIRRWSSEFGDTLSDHATPEKGKTRLFSDDDAAQLALVADMRRVNSSYESIVSALDAGDRGQWPPDDHQANQDDAGEAQSGEGASFPLVVQLTAKAANLEGELKATQLELTRRIEENEKLQTATKEEIDQLQKENNELRERAIRAETIIGVEKLGQPPETPAETNVSRENESGAAAAETPPAAPVKLSSWQRFRRRIAGV